MILNVHLYGAVAYDVGDEIWQQPLSNAIQAEAETIADNAGPGLLESLDLEHRAELRDSIAAEMGEALTQVGDTYRAPDGVRYSLVESPALDKDDDTIARMSSDAPIVERVLHFEDLPIGSNGSRRAIVRWTDGPEGEALKWWSDEIMICEGDHGNSRLMPYRVEMHGVAGSVRAWRGP